ncbi:MAG: hypothetical protein KJZ69_18810 [Phycisphaerales bacterium]|nr:hypothetical protein [Phycisphaerales bacterium]
MDLTNAKLKIERAEHHLKGLKQVIQSFFDLNHYTLKLKPNPSPPKYVLTASRDWIIPSAWSLIIGDYAHNARSSLDMIIYRLSSLAEGDRARLSLQFPIFDDAAKFQKAASSLLAGVSARHRAVIESFQPYQSSGAAQDNPLRLLAEINNADKHRLIHIVDVVSSVKGIGLRGPAKYGANLIAGGGAAIRLGAGAAVDAGGFFFRTLRDVEISNIDVPIAEIESAVPPKLNVQPHMTAQIKFGASCVQVQSRLVVDTLASILDRVREVLRQFDPSE